MTGPMCALPCLAFPCLALPCLAFRVIKYHVYALTCARTHRILIVILVSSVCLCMDNPLYDPNSNWMVALKWLDYVLLVWYVYGRTGSYTQLKYAQCLHNVRVHRVRTCIESNFQLYHM